MCAKYRNGFKCQIEVEVTRLREIMSYGGGLVCRFDTSAWDESAYTVQASTRWQLKVDLLLYDSWVTGLLAGSAIMDWAISASASDFTIVFSLSFLYFK